MPATATTWTISCAVALFIGSSAGARAPSADPLHSPECQAAREALAQAQADAASHRNGTREALATAREDARLACLGRDSGNAQRVGAPEPAIVVPPAVMEPPPAPRAVVVMPPAPAPPLQIQRPAAITACDPGGCWDSNGQRLNQLGPLLVGPHGACTVQGRVVQCP
jgi:hypothetical protein